ncbi:MAG: hypothetical protein OEY94_02680 [Alphaproteobacteria bacterium]|nr:hypothetical protein [Alphaproteobacteria bacterium]
MKDTQDLKKEPHVLSVNVNVAMREMIRISEKLVHIAEDETHSLVRGDMMHFAIAQREKEKLSSRYSKASEEFRARIEDFRKADKNLINKLDLLQHEIQKKTECNNRMIDQIKQKSMANTKATLMTAQDLGQRLISQPKNKIRAERKRA